jgi:hypothetical protein
MILWRAMALGRVPVGWELLDLSPGAVSRTQQRAPRLHRYLELRTCAHFPSTNEGGAKFERALLSTSIDRLEEFRGYSTCLCNSFILPNRYECRTNPRQPAAPISLRTVDAAPSPSHRSSQRFINLVVIDM